MTHAERHHASELESLSALLDGELPDPAARAVLKRLAGNAAERARAAEYWAVGDALRGLPGDGTDLTRKVMAALEHEPTILAPRRPPRHRRPALWLAAATVAAIAWGVWNAAPRQDTPGLAAAPAHPPANVTPYLAAHQDYTQALVADTELRISRITLAESGR